MHSSQQWPRQHRNLLTIVVSLTIAALLFAYFRLYPRWVAYSETKAEKASIENKLITSEWPKDSERLKAMLNELNKRLEKDNGGGVGLKAESAETMQRATGMFRQKIEDEYGEMSVFIQKASQTDYKAQYSTLENYFQGKGINLDSTIFGMNELTAEEEKYQMLLKLWTVQAVADCAIRSHMTVYSANLGGGNFGRRVSSISVLPMKSYYLNESDSSPYLLEFPVRMELEGSMENLYAFIDSLFTDGRFLPLTGLEITTTPLGSQGYPRFFRDGGNAAGAITAKVTCSSFFMPGDAPKKAPGPAKGPGNSTPRPSGI